MMMSDYDTDSLVVTRDFPDDYRPSVSGDKEKNPERMREQNTAFLKAMVHINRA